MFPKLFPFILFVKESIVMRILFEINLVHLLIDTEYLLFSGLSCSLTLPIFPLAAFVVEKLAQQKYISEQVGDSYTNYFIPLFCWLL